MGSDVALHEECASLRVQARGEEDARSIERLMAEGLWFDGQRQRMQIDDAVEGIGAILLRDPVAHGTEVVAEMEVA